MQKMILGLAFLLAVFPIAAQAQNNTTEAGKLAFDIPKADIDMLLKNTSNDVPPTDQVFRVMDMGKYNLGVGLIYRGPTKDKPGDPATGTYHNELAEIYVILSGSGVLTTGGRTADKKPRPEYLLPTGPGGSGSVGPGAYSRKVQTGDVIIIPAGVLHAWSQIPDHVAYLSMRPDPDRALPAGYVNPLLLKNLPPAASAVK